MSENNGYLSPYVGDGQDREGKIPAVAGKWSEVSFRYRPITTYEASQIYAKSRVFPTEPLVKWWSELLATKILSWTLKDSKGTALAISVEHLNGLVPEFFDALQTYIEIGGQEQLEDAQKN